MQLKLARDNSKQEQERRLQYEREAKLAEERMMEYAKSVLGDYAQPRENPLPESKREDLENRAPWEFRRYVKDIENPS
jgi:hypothetical protein